ncbi:TetR/AcrR family transcriptional regulator [Streptomyces aureocirculatus]|uniref:TetR/AcrR family transcriptional regulator n=1 Tax=Streptomyces aureocirculatus TaxID=67275 RepID=UPI0007C484C1|nr:TetR/AcrR family transcriptional regulator [Streptomyces aureocirculatus]
MTEQHSTRGRRPSDTQRSPRRSPAPHERQRDPERTKARILDAAMVEASAKGFAGARVSEIARRAGVNQQLISYYFGGKQGLFEQLGHRWRAHEAEAIPADTPLDEMIKRYVRAAADPRLGGRLLAWAGLADTGEDGPEARERNASLRQEVERLQERQRGGELDERLDAAALLLIMMSAANALAVYPQLARGLFQADPTSPEVVERYAAQLAHLIQHPVTQGPVDGDEN